MVADSDGGHQGENYGDIYRQNPKISTDQFLNNLTNAEILQFNSGGICYAFFTGYSSGLYHYATVFAHPTNAGWIARVLPPAEGRAHLAGFGAGFNAIPVSAAILQLYSQHLSLACPEPDMPDEDEDEDDQEGKMDDRKDDKNKMSADNYTDPNTPEVPAAKLSRLEFKRRLKQAEAEIRQGLEPDSAYWNGYMRGLCILHGAKFTEAEHLAWLSLTTGDEKRTCLICGFHDGYRAATIEDAKAHLQQTLVNMVEFVDAIAQKLAQKDAKAPAKPRQPRQRMFIMDDDEPDGSPEKPDTLH